ncbi:MAG: hypothetical protein ABJD66_03290 [Cellulophaga sp.]|uniref:hypothetical protein n=1 Tax=Cellulophaga sp. TaxID=1972202 RepID=UPI0032672CC6
MKKSINLSWKTVIIESLGLILLISGVKRFYFSTQPILNQETDKLTSESIVYFLMESALWGIGTLIFAGLIIGILKWKLKQSIIDSVLAIIFVFALFPFGFFNGGLFNSIFNSIGGLFTDIKTSSALISGIILTVIGFSLLWRSIKSKIKQHTTPYI